MNEITTQPADNEVAFSFAFNIYAFGICFIVIAFLLAILTQFAFILWPFLLIGELIIGMRIIGKIAQKSAVQLAKKYTVDDITVTVKKSRTFFGCLLLVPSILTIIYKFTLGQSLGLVFEWHYILSTLLNLGFFVVLWLYFFHLSKKYLYSSFSNPTSASFLENSTAAPDQAKPEYSNKTMLIWGSILGILLLPMGYITATTILAMTHYYSFKDIVGVLTFAGIQILLALISSIFIRGQLSKFVKAYITCSLVATTIICLLLIIAK
jgi:hypothetical protein